MKRLQLLIALPMILLLFTACGTLPKAPMEEPKEPQSVEVENVVQEEIPEQPEAPDLTAFEGIYRANAPQEGDAGYVQITSHGDFLMLEHFLCMEGSVYSFRAEEFWPKEDGFTTEEFISLSGRSQTFSMMTAGDGYDTMPQNRVITLTEEGVVLNYDDSDAEYYVTDTAFSYHTAEEELLQHLGESMAETEEMLFGTWSFQNDRETVVVRFQENGSIYLLRKKAQEPAQVYYGAFIFEEGSSISVMAEKIGDGQYPHFMNLQWKVHGDGALRLAFEGEEEFLLMPTQESAVQ